MQKIVENYCKSGKLEEVGKHRYRGQVLEVPDTGQESHWDEDDEHVEVVVHLPIPMIKDLLHALADEHEVDATEAELGDAEEHLNHAPRPARPPPEQRVIRGGEAGLHHVRIREKREIRSPTQLLRVTHQ